MNIYETIFIMKDDITEEQRNITISEIREYLNNNGKIIDEEDKGLKILAYEVNKYKKGYYYWIYFESKSESIAGLERIYRYTDEILKFITIKQNMEEIKL